MAEELEYSHISVSSDDEEEVVIQAGATSSRVAAVQGQQSAATARGQRVPSADVLAQAGLEADDISEEAREEYERHMRRSAARQEAARMVTTEEDLHTAMPFARMQRTVVIVFALILVAALIYWFVKHPIV